MSKQVVRASEIKTGMVILVDGWGMKLNFTVSFCRKHRRYPGYMQVQGASEKGFAELSLKRSDTFERIK